MKIAETKGLHMVLLNESQFVQFSRMIIHLFKCLLQMLVCSEDDNMKEEEDISPKKESKRFVWNHGSRCLLYHNCSVPLVH